MRRGNGALRKPAALVRLLVSFCGPMRLLIVEDDAPLASGLGRMLEAEGHAVETPQDESQATLASKLSRETSKIDWAAPADQIALQIRGLGAAPAAADGDGERGRGQDQGDGPGHALIQA